MQKIINFSFIEDETLVRGIEAGFVQIQGDREDETLVRGIETELVQIQGDRYEKI